MTKKQIKERIEMLEWEITCNIEENEEMKKEIAELKKLTPKE